MFLGGLEPKSKSGLTAHLKHLAPFKTTSIVLPTRRFSVLVVVACRGDGSGYGAEGNR